MTSEDKLLLYCAQTGISETAKEKAKELINLPLNWNNVLESAFWHGIAPLLYHNLKEIQDGHLIPQEAMEQLKKAYYFNMAKNIGLFAELNPILNAFSQNGIKVIVLKGAALAETVYGDIGLRPMGDIDLLVKKEDLSKVDRILSDLGYFFKGIKPQEWYEKNYYQIKYKQLKKNILVEIHWDITWKLHPLRIRSLDKGMIEIWWKNSKAAEFSGKKALVLCPEDLLLHLCLHFFKHRFSGRNAGFSGRFNSRGALIQLYDILQTLNHYKDEINWSEFKCKTDKYGINKVIYVTLLLLKKVFRDHDNNFYQGLDKFSSDSLDNKLIHLIYQKIFVREDKLTFVPGPIIQYKAAYSFQEKVKTLLKSIFPNPEVIAKTYSVPPSSMRLYCYYVIRPFILLLKYGKIVSERPRIKDEVILKRWMSTID